MRRTMIRHMQPVVYTEDGLVLRPLRLEDAEAVVVAASDPEIRRWTDAPNPFTIDAARAFVAQTLQWWLDGALYSYGVFAEATGELIGGGLGRPLDDRGEALDIGGWLALTSRARGLSVTAFRAASRMAFDAYKFQRLVARIEIGNHASRAVAERIGFLVEGVDAAHFGGRGAWIATLLRDELLEKDAPEPESARRTRAFGTGSRRRRRIQAQGGQITLRALAERDVEDVVAAYADPNSRRWTGADDDYGLTQAQHLVGTYAPGRWARQEAAVYAIADAEDRFAGAIELVPSPADPEVAAISVMIAPWARGLGYAPAALRELSAWGFTGLGLARIEGRADSANEAARRAAEKAGFVAEGVQRAGWLLHGKRTDAFVVSLLPADLAGA
jgi:RimJ/RimL family protein N-acetyltransferase